MPSHDKGKGKLFIIGTGPGNLDQLTARARNALGEAEYIIGNAAYLTPLAELLGGKQVISSSMGREVERARTAVELAQDHRVAMVSGGDPGVYGMASIVLELVERTGRVVDVEVVPGITAATAAASLLGSPLSGDFVVLSLSDLLVPLEVIEERLSAALSMGVPIVLYNPKSRGRPHNFSRAMEIAGRFRRPDTPVGIVKNAYREEETVIITTLREIMDCNDEVDMHSSVIIGGEESRIWKVNGDARGIITPRGYHKKYVY
ncbi:precorrin-3B C17-methyltransferase [Methanolinea mesophila]|uniref:precorrin-3B C(17)-methyltransferase n=1 Tax=Methanolinea mesophila TaxID=547055 RepID=UPI001AE5B98C|nr:precorrin-3B C(17)-methyltransferase [Methanolinea mesophila]MBP1929606.1 precorrin-3B C17-methyltransferase [Methanolinea mesophila]